MEYQDEQRGRRLISQVFVPINLAEDVVSAVCKVLAARELVASSQLSALEMARRFALSILAAGCMACRHRAATHTCQTSVDLFLGRNYTTIGHLFAITEADDTYESLRQFLLYNSVPPTLPPPPPAAPPCVPVYPSVLPNQQPPPASTASAASLSSAAAAAVSFFR
jgi:hypothetical protein